MFMKRIRLKQLFGAVLSSVLFSGAVWGAEVLTLSGRDYSADFNRRTGALEGLVQNGRKITIGSGKNGLWSAEWRKGGTVSAGNFSPAEIKLTQTGDSAVFTYENKEIKVAVTLTAKPEYLDFQATVTPFKDDVKSFTLPGELLFPAKEVKGIVCQPIWPRNVGMELNSSFFSDRSSAENPRWTRGKVIAGGAYAKFFGGGPVNLFPSQEFSELSVTEEATSWLGEELAGKLEKLSVQATRPFAKDQAKIKLAEAPAGTFLGGVQFNGKGYLFRAGGFFAEKDKPLQRKIFHALAREAAGRNNKSKIALIDFPGTPVGKRNLQLEVEAWREELSSDGAEVIRLQDIASLQKALSDPAVGAIINPYEEMCPAPLGKSLVQFADTIRNYLKNGGSWFEVTGYSFHYQMEPERYLSISGSAPCAMADCFPFQMSNGNFAVYSVQPFGNYPAWDKDHLYIPSGFKFSGSPEGGRFRRFFNIFVKKDTALDTPVVRIRFNTDPMQAAEAFCKDNQSTRLLSAKLDPEKFRQLAEAVLYKIDIPKVNDGYRYVEMLPAGGILHFHNYMKHGFDRGLPEITPIAPGFGTKEEFLKLLGDMKQKGFLFMPYINNTYWCVAPVKCEYFKNAGDEPLLISINGNRNMERYAEKIGYSITMWHPAVREACRMITEAFVNEYPADFIFQDQTGGKGNTMDFNPASPAPHAYSSGLISTARDDAARIPLSTEDGWYGVMDSMVQFCGASFGLVEPRASAAWNLLWEEWPRDTFRFFSQVGAIAHDKVVLSHHNLGGYVHNPRQLSLTLGLGYTLIIRTHFKINGKETDIITPAFLEYIRFVDALQKNLVADYIGKPMRSFRHEWSKEDIGTIRAVYGDVTVTANLDSEPLDADGISVAPNGFLAVSPRAAAGYSTAADGRTAPVLSTSHTTEKSRTVTGGDGFVITADKAWIYAPGGAEVTFPLVSDKVTEAVLPDGTILPLTVSGKTAKVTLPPQDVTYPVCFALKLQ